ncbi:GTP-binding protein [Anaeroglobus geminatus]|uniref:GTP-binding protein n=1 Tax=Anaeroglobus geminatus TaxID=156456 RepID=UPI000A050E04
MKRSEEYLAGAGGAVIRVKGVLPVAGGFIELQYSGRHIETEPSQSDRAALTVIGTALDEVAVRNTWT